MSDEASSPNLLRRLRRQTFADMSTLQHAASRYQEDLRKEVDPDLAYQHHLHFEEHYTRLTAFSKQSKGLFSALRTNLGHTSQGLLRDVKTARRRYLAASAAAAQERKEFVTLQHRPRKQRVRQCYWNYFPSARIFPTLSLDEGRHKFEVEVGIPLECSPFNACDDSDMARTYTNKKLFFASSRSDGGDAEVTVLKRIKLPSDPFHRAIARKEVENLKLMSKEGCPCLIQYIASGTVESLDPLEPSYLCLVTQYIEGCSLLRWIQTQRQSVGEQSVKSIIKQAVSALHFIHSRGIIHRRISPKSILLDVDHNIKIINLDVYTSDDDVRERRRSLLTHTATITEDYDGLTGELRAAIQHGCNFWSPEFITRGDISYSADIWALGCTALYLSTGPWSFTQGLELFNYQRGSGQEPSTIAQVIDKHLQDTFVRPTMRLNPTTRPTAEDLCQRPEMRILVTSHFSDSRSTLSAGVDGL